MHGIACSLTPALARALAKRGLVTPLLQVRSHPTSGALPCRHTGLWIVKPETAALPSAPICPVFSCTITLQVEMLVPSVLQAHLTPESSPLLGHHHLTNISALFTVQGLPWRPTSAEPADDVESWETTVVGTRAVCSILAAFHTPATRTAMLPDGSWDAAVQRVRCAPAV